MGKRGIVDAYTTGRGTIRVRGKAHVEEIGNGKSQIIITEIPYQVNKKNLIESIAELAHSKRIDGLTDLRDESDRNGMRIVLELRRGRGAPNPAESALQTYTTPGQLRHYYAGSCQRRTEDP